jgi:hypothetical protein
MAAKRHVWRPRTSLPVDRYGTTERVRRGLLAPGGMPVGIASVTALRYSAVPTFADDRDAERQADLGVGHPAR